MIHVMMPTQYAGRSGGRVDEPNKRLMAAVLRTVVDDCRGGSVYRHAAGHAEIDTRSVRAAIEYIASTDRAWPFSFENLCEALGLDAEALREALQATRVPA